MSQNFLYLVLFIDFSSFYPRLDTFENNFTLFKTKTDFTRFPEKTKNSLKYPALLYLQKFE